MNHARRGTQRAEPTGKSAGSDRLVGAMINGRYRVTARIGAGGMGKVYLADQLPLDRPVALKILDVLGPDLPNLKKRFLREACVLSKLQHPNIVTVYDYGTSESGESERGESERGATSERYFMAMEFLSGKTLAQRAAEGPMSISSVVRITSQIALGLGEAHAQGLVHRDLKPSNVMLITGRDGEERVKIIDFGIVKLVGDNRTEEELTLDGSVVGSPRYMAPEQFLSTHNLDQRTDIWALGVVLYGLLTGRAPFEAENMSRLVHGVLDGPTPRVLDSRPDAPPQLDAIVARCLEKSPAKRFGAMADVAAALDSLYPRAPSVGPSAEPRRSLPETLDEGEGGDALSRDEIASVSVVAVPARARNGAAIANLQKVILGLVAASLIAFAVARSRRSVPAPAAGNVSIPQSSVAAKTVRESELTIPEPASVLVLASAFSAPTPARALHPKEPKPHSRPKPRVRPKASPDDDIPTLR